MSAIVFYLVLFWGGSEPGVRHKESHDLATACKAQAGAKDEYSKVIRISRHEPSFSYAVNCVTGNCPSPPAAIIVQEVKCIYVPEAKTVKEFVTPGHWEER